jgi:uncharacterized protein DUF6492
MNIEVSDKRSNVMDSKSTQPTAKPIRFAIITPSYYVDFERCKWLVETVNRFVPEDIPHYLVVDYADRDLFASLRSSRTRVVFKEDALGGRLHQVPFARKWWVGLRSPPARGWIVQQITKLFVTEVVEEEAFAFVDSGCFFVRPFDPRTMERNGEVRLFRETGPYFQNPVTFRWHSVNAKLLGIRPVIGYDVGYVTQLVTWRRDNLLHLQKHLELVSGRNAIDTLARQLTFSEYYLYGMYCDMVLNDRSRHYHTPIAASLCYWELESLSEAALVRLKTKLEPDHVVVLINEKSRTSLEYVRSAFGAWNA